MNLETRKEIKMLLSQGDKLAITVILLKTLSIDWDDLLSPTCEEDSSLNFTISELSEIESLLNQVTQKACKLSEYIGYRGTFGCGDSGHDEALNKSEKRLTKVRKALGYTYP